MSSERNNAIFKKKAQLDQLVKASQELVKFFSLYWNFRFAPDKEKINSKLGAVTLYMKTLESSYSWENFEVFKASCEQFKKLLPEINGVPDCGDIQRNYKTHKSTFDRAYKIMSQIKNPNFNNTSFFSCFNQLYEGYEAFDEKIQRKGTLLEKGGWSASKIGVLSSLGVALLACVELAVTAAKLNADGRNLDVTKDFISGLPTGGELFNVVNLLNVIGLVMIVKAGCLLYGTWKEWDQPKVKKIDESDYLDRSPVPSLTSEPEADEYLVLFNDETDETDQVFCN
jgi:hypothetical protein